MLYATKKATSDRLMMHYDVTSCVICISNNVEYLEKKGSYKNSAKEVALSFQVIFATGQAVMIYFQGGLCPSLGEMVDCTLMTTLFLL